MKKFFLVALVASLFALIGCTSVYPVCATSNDVGSKVGTASGSAILGTIFTGDASIKKAAKEAGITKISTVDQKVTTILWGVYIGYTTVVTGE